MVGKRVKFKEPLRLWIDGLVVQKGEIGVISHVDHATNVIFIRLDKPVPKLDSKWSNEVALNKGGQDYRICPEFPYHCEVIS